MSRLDRTPFTPSPLTGTAVACLVCDVCAICVQAILCLVADHPLHVLGQQCGASPRKHDSNGTDTRCLRQVKAMYEAYGISTQMAELRNLVTVGELIVSSAMQRKESRGLHYSMDHPAATPDQCRETVIKASFRKRYDLTQVKQVVDSNAF